MPTLAPFANEPVLELRRAAVRAQLGRRAGGVDATLPLRVPVIDRRGDARAATALHRPPTPATPTGSSRGPRRPTRADVGRARSTRRPARLPGLERATRASDRARALLARRRLDARAPARAGRARGARVRQAVARGRRRRVRGDRLPRVLRARRARARARAGSCSRCPASATSCATCPRGVVAVISPWNFPLAIPCGMTAAALATGQRRRAQARRAVAGLRAAARARRCAPAASRRRRSRCCPARATSARRSSATPRCTTIAFTGSLPVGLEIVRAAAEPAPRPAPHQARRRRARRQELRDRRRRRRPRRGGPGDRRLGVRLRGPEVLGGLPRARPRGDRRRS